MLGPATHAVPLVPSTLVCASCGHISPLLQASSQGHPCLALIPTLPKAVSPNLETICHYSGVTAQRNVWKDGLYGLTLAASKRECFW
jgi:hypothetical protein